MNLVVPGRNYGEDLLFKNREGSDFILGPTHEEIFTAIVRDSIKTETASAQSISNPAKYRDENVLEFVFAINVNLS